MGNLYLPNQKKRYIFFLKQSKFPSIASSAKRCHQIPYPSLFLVFLHDCDIPHGFSLPHECVPLFNHCYYYTLLHQYPYFLDDFNYNTYMQFSPLTVNGLNLKSRQKEIVNQVDLEEHIKISCIDNQIHVWLDPPGLYVHDHNPLLHQRYQLASSQFESIYEGTFSFGLNLLPK